MAPDNSNSTSTGEVAPLAAVPTLRQSIYYDEVLLCPRWECVDSRLNKLDGMNEHVEVAPLFHVSGEGTAFNLELNIDGGAEFVDWRREDTLYETTDGSEDPVTLKWVSKSRALVSWVGLDPSWRGWGRWIHKIYVAKEGVRKVLFLAFTSIASVERNSLLKSLDKKVLSSSGDVNSPMAPALKIEASQVLDMVVSIDEDRRVRFPDMIIDESFREGGLPLGIDAEPLIFVKKRGVPVEFKFEVRNHLLQHDTDNKCNARLIKGSDTLALFWHGVTDPVKGVEGCHNSRGFKGSWCEASHAGMRWVEPEVGSGPVKRIATFFFGVGPRNSKRASGSPKVGAGFLIDPTILHDEYQMGGG